MRKPSAIRDPFLQSKRAVIWLVALLGLLAAVGPGFMPRADVGVDSVTGREDERSCETPCPGDNEEGECPPDCDACPCCPTAASAAVSLGGSSLSYAGLHVRAPDIEAPGQAKDGTRSRVYRPPRRA